MQENSREPATNSNSAPAAAVTATPTPAAAPAPAGAPAENRPPAPAVSESEIAQKNREKLFNEIMNGADNKVNELIGSINLTDPDKEEKKGIIKSTLKDQKDSFKKDGKPDIALFNDFIDFINKANLENLFGKNKDITSKEAILMWKGEKAGQQTKEASDKLKTKLENVRKGNSGLNGFIIDILGGNDKVEGLIRNGGFLGSILAMFLKITDDDKKGLNTSSNFAQELTKDDGYEKFKKAIEKGPTVKSFEDFSKENKFVKTKGGELETMVKSDEKIGEFMVDITRCHSDIGRTNIIEDYAQEVSTQDNGIKVIKMKFKDANYARMVASYYKEKDGGGGFGFGEIMNYFKKGWQGKSEKSTQGGSEKENKEKLVKDLEEYKKSGGAKVGPKIRIISQEPGNRTLEFKFLPDTKIDEIINKAKGGIQGDDKK